MSHSQLIILRSILKMGKIIFEKLLNFLIVIIDLIVIIWYTDGQYQGGTPSGCASVNLFDPDTNLIAVYQKQPDGSNLFLTTCKLTQMEGDHLKATNGNFVTERILKEQSAVSTNIQDNTNNNNGLQ